MMESASALAHQESKDLLVSSVKGDLQALCFAGYVRSQN